MTTVNEGNTNKTEVQDEFIFRSVSLVCCTIELDEKTDSQSMYMHVSLLLKLYGCNANEQYCVSVFMF